MWFGNFEGKVFYIENGSIRPYRYNDVLEKNKGSFDYLGGIIVSGCGKELWLASGRSGLMHVDEKGRFELLPFKSQCYIHCLEIGDRYLSSFIPKGYNFKMANAYIPSVLFQKGRQQITSDSFPVTLRAESITALKEKLRERRWLMTWKNNLMLFKDGKIEWVKDYPLQPIFAFEDENGRIFMGHYQNNGLSVYASIEDLHAGKVAATFLNGLNVSCIFKDREGGYWFGTQQKGVFYCPSLENGLLEGVPGIDNDIVKGVTTDKQDQLYVGMQNGNVFNVNLRLHQAKDITPGTVLLTSTLYFDDETNTLCVAGQNMSFYRTGVWLDNKFYVPNRNHWVAHSCNRAAKETGNNSWIIVNGLFTEKIDMASHRVTQTSIEDLGKAERFYAVCFDPAKRIWVSDNKGLFEYKDHQLIKPAVPHPVFDQTTTDILARADGTLVFCPKGYGVALWKPGSAAPIVIGAEQGLLSNKVTRLFLEADTTIWACTDHGVSKITFKVNGKYVVDNLTVQNGLPSNNVSQVTATDGYYWIATDKGLLRLQKKPQATPIAAPVFESILVNNQSYLPLFGQKDVQSGNFSLPHDSSDVSIEWAALHFHSNGQIPYQYRLVNGVNDTIWVITSDRRINYANLSSGAYLFQVKAQNEEGKWGPTANFYFTIRPPWYATWWFEGLAICALLGGAYWLYRSRIATLQKEAAVEQQINDLERRALQAQMNPHFIFNCLNSIQHSISTGDKEDAMRYTSRFAQLTRAMLNFSGKSKIGLDEEIPALENYMELEKLRFGNQLNFEIVVAPDLDIFETAIPPMLIQPFLENAFKHGRPSQIDLHFTKNSQYLVVTVRDDGEGLGALTNKSNQSKGIAISRQRLNIWNGDNNPENLSIESLEKGVLVTLKIRTL
jgi:ligand-binding sensor domain-containing protein